MHIYVLAACLLAQPSVDAGIPAAAGAEDGAGPLEELRDAYREDAEKYSFSRDAGQLTLVKEPIMHWANDNDWSGDVFVWTHQGRPEVIGCILSGPTGDHRFFYHEFHLSAETPITPTKLQTRRTWKPEAGLQMQLVPDAPKPAATASARLVQMRQMSRHFTAHMNADGPWQLRLLPQPLYRYGSDDGTVLDGALFAYVWTRGTDPEVLLLLECRKTTDDWAWHYAPVRFSNRSVWLRHADSEVWRAESHQEPRAGSTSLLYTTAYARAIPKEAAEDPNRDDQAK